MARGLIVPGRVAVDSL